MWSKPPFDWQHSPHQPCKIVQVLPIPSDTLHIDTAGYEVPDSATKYRPTEFDSVQPWPCQRVLASCAMQLWESIGVEQILSSSALRPILKRYIIRQWEVCHLEPHTVATCAFQCFSYFRGQPLIFVKPCAACAGGASGGAWWGGRCRRFRAENLSFWDRFPTETSRFLTSCSW